MDRDSNLCGGQEARDRPGATGSPSGEKAKDMIRPSSPPCSKVMISVGHGNKNRDCHSERA